MLTNYYCRDSELSYVKGIGFQSAPPKERAGIFNMPEDGSFKTQILCFLHDSNCLSDRPDRYLLSWLTSHVAPSTWADVTSTA